MPRPRKAAHLCGSVIPRKNKNGTAFALQLKLGDSFQQRVFPWLQLREEAESALLIAKIAMREGHDPWEAVARMRRPQTSDRNYGRLLKEWVEQLDHKGAKGHRTNVRGWLNPQDGKLPPFPSYQQVDQVQPADIVLWLDEVKKITDLSAHYRHGWFESLSRFFSWCKGRGYVTFNPVTAVDKAERIKRPRTRRAGEPAEVFPVIDRMREPYNLMMYLCTTSGIRPGEVRGLRMSDLDFVETYGTIRVRYNADGRLKEDIHDEGKVKWPAAPLDLMAKLGPWLERRRAEGAGPEDYVFPGQQQDQPLSERTLRRAWRKAADALDVNITCYEAGRHTAFTEAFKHGVPLDRVSQWAGHGSTEMTKTYVHHVPRTASLEERAMLASPTRPEALDDKSTIESLRETCPLVRLAESSVRERCEALSTEEVLSALVQLGAQWPKNEKPPVSSLVQAIEELAREQAHAKWPLVIAAHEAVIEAHAYAYSRALLQVQESALATVADAPAAPPQIATADSRDGKAAGRSRRRHCRSRRVA